MSKKSNIRTRRDLADWLEGHMSRSYNELRKNLRLEADTNLPKTYLLEFDWPSEPVKNETEFLTQSLSLPKAKNSHDLTAPKVVELAESGLYRVTWDSSEGDVETVVDTVDASATGRRFWSVFSVAQARPLERTISRLIGYQSAVDRLWLWPSLLRQTQARGNIRGFSLDFDRRPFEKAEGDQDPTDMLKMQVWGGDESQEILEAISAIPHYRQRTTVSKIRMKYIESQSNDPSRFSLEDVKYDGKMTTRGTSASAHLDLVKGLRDSYASTIGTVESDFIIRAEAGDALALNGHPIVFDVSSCPIEDLDLFCQIVFSGNYPFRMWGVPKKLPGTVEARGVDVVDMHTASKLFFEIYPDVIRMYLYQGACGNTAARFYTNLQQKYVAGVTAKGRAGIDVF